MALLKQCRRCGVLIHKPATRNCRVCDECKSAIYKARRRTYITCKGMQQISRNNTEGNRFYKSAIGRKFVASSFKTNIRTLRRFITTSQKYLDTHRSVDLEYKAYLEMKINAAQSRLKILLGPLDSLDKSTGQSE